MESYISNVCYQARKSPPPPGPPLPPDPDPERPLWFKLYCRGVLTQEVVRELYTEPECRIQNNVKREVHEAGVCLIELDNSIFVANIMFDCGEHEQQWPVNGMSLMAIGIL